MDDYEVAKFWESNSEAWQHLARLGYDHYRDCINTPAFMAMLPEVRGLSGLDLGCGEGHNTRLVAGRDARMCGIDISESFIKGAQDAEREKPLGIDYRLASAAHLPFAEHSFDFVMATMSLMDMPDHRGAFTEAFRVLKPGGFFQFSIAHPCFTTARWKWVQDEKGRNVALECGDYFSPPQGLIDEWIFSAAPIQLKQKYGKFRIPRFFRTLSSWLNLLLEVGFTLECFDEPKPNAEAIAKYPHIEDAAKVAYFLLVRCRKPAGGRD